MDELERMMLDDISRMIIEGTANGMSLPEIGMMLFMAGHDSGHFCAQMGGESHDHFEPSPRDQVSAGYL